MSIILDKTYQQIESHETQKVLYSKKKKKCQLNEEATYKRKENLC